MKEIWKDIKGFPNYMISNTGEVKSKERYTENNGGFQLRKEILLKQEITKHGYNRVNLYKKGKNVKVSVHRLVAEHFIPNKDNKIEINHLDGIKTNNNVENLNWCTKKENVKHAIKTGLRKIIKDIALIKDGKIKKFENSKTASLEIGCTQNSILRVIRKERKSIYGWKLYEES